VQVAKKDARAEKAQYKITVVGGVLADPAAATCQHQSSSTKLQATHTVRAIYTCPFFPF
jgi:hypothetical protein